MSTRKRAWVSILSALLLASGAPAVSATAPWGGIAAHMTSRTAPPRLRAISPGQAIVASNATTGFGLFEDLQYLTGADLTKRLDAYEATGVTWARFQLIWSAVQRSGPASYDWGPYDALVAGLVARGIKPLAVLTTTPTWARPSGCIDLTCAPADPASYATFARKAAQRFTGRIAAFELWNEPNSAEFYKPSPDPVRYAALVKAAYPVIKAADPTAAVITGGLAPAIDVRSATGWATRAPLGFLSAVYDQGAAGSFDAVGWHPYCYPSMPGTTDPGNAWYQMYGPKTSARSLMVAHGDSAKQIWATEMGAHTDLPAAGGLSEKAQADTLSKAADLWAGYAWAGPLVVYQLQDHGASPRDRENFFGLLRFNGTPKPAYSAFLAAIRTHPVRP